MDKIVEALQSDGIVLIPTDTTFGLSALPTQKAVKRLNELKGRSNHQRFLLLVNSERQLQDLVEVPDLAWDLIDLAEKPLTIVYDNILKVPEYLLADDGTIAIRLVKNVYLNKLINKIKSPLLSTSANLTGQDSPKYFEEIPTEILNSIDAIAEEARDFEPIFKASSIIQLSTSGQVKVLRE